MKTVFVGLSGGVDSSVAALLLKEQGDFNVVGAYMKNWSQNLPGFQCPWLEDYQDAKRIAVQLGIDFLMFDFEKEYKKMVVDYMIEEYKLGNTPNPDIMCNQEIKFKLFLNAARAKGADLVATGHYANVKNGRLLNAKDQAKDQTYFLYRLQRQALRQTIFPLGNYLKSEVRQIAQRHNLITQDKKESMGICFVGKVGIAEFLSNYVETEPGSIIDQNGIIIGQHNGAIFYTIGQRHGLNVGGGLPYYVTGKDMAKNEVYVTSDLNDARLWASQVALTAQHWINDPPQADKIYDVRVRHQGRLTKARYAQPNINFNDPLRALNPGQSIVVYDQNVVLGGGIISSVKPE